MKQEGSGYILKVEPTFPSGHKSLASTIRRRELTSTEMGKTVDKTICGVGKQPELEFEYVKFEKLIADDTSNEDTELGVQYKSGV